MLNKVLNLLSKYLVYSPLALFLGVNTFVVLADILVVKVVGEELERVVVVTEQLVVSVYLIGKSAFLDKKSITAPSLMSSTGVWQ